MVYANTHNARLCSYTRISAPLCEAFSDSPKPSTSRLPYHQYLSRSKARHNIRYLWGDTLRQDLPAAPQPASTGRSLFQAPPSCTINHAIRSKHLPHHPLGYSRANLPIHLEASGEKIRITVAWVGNLNPSLKWCAEPPRIAP